MSHHRFKNIDHFRGKLSQDKSVDPSVYERTQFLRYYGGKKGVVD
jgi:dihydroorotate dehydrogenase (fumarate)